MFQGGEEESAQVRTGHERVAIGSVTCSLAALLGVHEGSLPPLLSYSVLLPRGSCARVDYLIGNHCAFGTMYDALWCAHQDANEIGFTSCLPSPNGMAVSPFGSYLGIGRSSWLP
jgi:hypothetical protein